MADSRIGKTRVLAFAAAMMVLLCSTSAHSRTVEHGEIYSWFLQEQYNPETDAFMDCVVLKDYENGFTLAYGIRYDFEFEFWIVHEDWSYATGDQRRFELLVDDLQPISVEAEAVSGNMLYTLIPLDLLETVGDAFFYGDRLTVSDGTVEFNFDLHGLGHALEAANECAVSVRKAENPEQPSTKESDESGIHSLLRAAMSRPEMWAFEIFDDGSEAAYSFDADLVWMGPGASGIGLAIPLEGFDLHDALSNIVANNESGCVKNVRFERLEDRLLPNNANAISLLVECDDGSGETTTVFTYFPYSEFFLRLSHINTGISKTPVYADKQLVQAIVDVWEDNN
ncbi:MAG: hypothetical protein RIM72_06615 [Alphaproteobacteria bacterium]